MLQFKNLIYVIETEICITRNVTNKGENYLKYYLIAILNYTLKFVGLKRVIRIAREIELMSLLSLKKIHSIRQLLTFR